MTEQIGELNGAVKSLTETVERYAETNENLHRQHGLCCAENKVEIGRINARHATYWKVIGLFGGGGTLAAFLSKLGGGAGQ